MKIKRSSAALAAGLAAVAFLTGSARAAVIIDIDQAGSSVVATWSGTVDLTDLALRAYAIGKGGIIDPSRAFIDSFPQDSYGGGDSYGHSDWSSFSGPSDFGAGGEVGATGTTGDVFLFAPSLFLTVPAGYKSGSYISGGITWAGATLDGLGLARGVYTWTWGSGDHADGVTIRIGAVPEPSSFATMAVGGLGALGVAGRRRPRAGSPPA